MEQTATINSALERIDNPILIILIAVLMMAVVALWFQSKGDRQKLYDLAVETIGAIKDTNTRLSTADDRMERIEATINNSTNAKKN